MISVHDRVRLRRTLVQLSGLLALTLLASGLVSLFSLWSMERLHAVTSARQAALVAAIDAAREAQVHFKIEVQSWKNVLLRGAEAADYKVFSAELAREQKFAEAALQRVLRWAEEQSMGDTRETMKWLVDEHERVKRAYGKAMPAQESIGAMFAIADRSVRGVDRPLNDGLDNLVASLMASAEQERETARQAEQARFAMLNRSAWAALGISLLLVFALLGRTLRDPAIRG